MEARVGNEVAKIDASQPPEGWAFSEWSEFLKGLAPLLADESDAKWRVGDYLVGRIGSTARTVDYHNGRDAVLRETARVFLLSEHTLKDRYVTSAKFAPEDRVFDVAWTVYRQFADREDSVTQLRAFVEAGGVSKREAAKHLGTNEGNVGAPLIARSLADNPEKVADLVAELPAETREELVRQVANQDYITAARAVNTSNPRKEFDKDSARRQKAKAAYQDGLGTPGPVGTFALHQLVMSWMPDFEKFVNAATERGMTDEATQFTKAFLAQWRGMADVLEASLNGDLEPLAQDEFDRAIAAITEGGAA